MKLSFHKPFKEPIIIICFLCVNLLSQTIQTTAVQSNSGGIVEGGIYTLHGTIGQSSPPGTATGGNQLVLSSGFLNTLGLAPTILTLIADPASPSPAKQSVQISATVFDDIDIQSVNLHYRQGGSTNFTQKMMENNGGIYKAVIPEDSVSNRGIEYYITARNVEGNISKSPSSGFISHRVALSGKGIASPGIQPSGSEQKAYRIISIPLELDNKSPQAVLGDDLGKYDKTKWRFFNEDKQEFPNTGDIEGGEGFWLIVKSGGKRIDSGAGTTNITSEPFLIKLKPGWNLIGNPFNFDVSVTESSLRFEHQQSMPMLRSFANGEWNNQNINPVSELKPFEGYAVHSDTTIDDFLVIDPYNQSSGNSPHNNNENILWSIQILAQSQEARDEDNMAVVRTDSKVEWDLFDFPEPPAMGEYVSVYFPHTEWDKITKKYCADARPYQEEGIIWEFAVQTNIHDKVSLTFDNLRSVPPEFEIWVVDENLNVATNLREKNDYNIAGPTEKNHRALLLIAGKKDFISDKVGNILSIPDDFEVSQNFPNPFNPSTTIRFGLPQSAKVTLKIFNLLGQEITTLINKETLKEGYYTYVWDGRNQNGQKVASGVYFYYFQADRFVKSEKMIMAK